MLPVYNTQGSFIKAIKANSNNPLAEFPGYSRLQSIEKKVIDSTEQASHTPYLVAIKEGESVIKKDLTVVVKTQGGSKHLFVRHPFTPVSSFKHWIQAKFPGTAIELIYQGKPITNPYETLSSINFLENDTLFAINNKTLPLKNETFSVCATLNTTNEVRMIKVRAQQNLGSLRAALSEYFNLPEIKIRISYCGGVLSDDSRSLSHFMFTPNCKLDVVDSREFISQDQLHRSVHRRTSKDSEKNVSPLKLKHTDSFSFKEVQPL